MTPPVAILATAALGASIVWVVAVFGIAIRSRFYSVIDVAWAYGFIGVALLCGFLGSHATVTWVLCGMVSLWALRLGTHLLLRLKSHFPTEDGRYAELLRTWGAQAKPKFFVFFLMQGFSIVLLSSPMLLVSQDESESLSVLRWIALALWVVGWVGESVADRQLKHFKKNPQMRGQVCDRGLWRYSRHPNYFFEWLMWCSFALFALEAPLGWVAITAPLTILYLLLRVTGIPATEAQSLRTKQELYRRYQETTSVFVPWFRKA